MIEREGTCKYTGCDPHANIHSPLVEGVLANSVMIVTRRHFKNTMFPSTFTLLEGESCQTGRQPGAPSRTLGPIMPNIRRRLLLTKPDLPPSRSTKRAKSLF